MNFCSQEMALRPLICAQPVMPGRTSWRRACVLLYRGRYSTNNGLGPMRLMSPLSTLMSWGISSKLVLRMNLPTGVRRTASGRRFPTASFFSFIVLNLMTLKSLPCLPGRVWVKKGLPELAMESRIVMSRNRGDSSSRAMRLRRKSRDGLKILLYICLKTNDTY